MHSAKAAAGLLLSILLFVSAGCVSAPVKNTLASDLASRKAKPSLVEKVRKGASLSASEIASALKSGVSQPALLSYVKQSGAIYELQAQDIKQLTSAGANDDFINYLLQTTKMKRQKPDLQGPLGPQPLINPALVPNIDR
jgi:hypothetical protein